MTTEGRVPPSYFDRHYQEAYDPWGFATSDYERAKYERTVEALGDRTFDRGLELGCSIGVLTALLADRCRSLLAVDISVLAVERARARLKDAAHVRVERRTLPEEMPGGEFDLVLCSEILYYFERKRLERIVETIEERVAAGGVLIAVHWRLSSADHLLLGDEVHELLLAATGLEHSGGFATGDYRLDKLVRPP